MKTKQEISNALMGALDKIELGLDLNKVEADLILQTPSEDLDTMCPDADKLIEAAKAFIGK